MRVVISFVQTSVVSPLKLVQIFYQYNALDLIHDETSIHHSSMLHLPGVAHFSGPEKSPI
jgi:hypothetical protein